MRRSQSFPPTFPKKSSCASVYSTLGDIFTEQEFNVHFRLGMPSCRFLRGPLARHSLIAPRKGTHNVAKEQSTPAKVKPAAPIDLYRVDWGLLRQQKLTLVNLQGNGCYNRQIGHDLQGILHLLDNIQDQAALALGERRVSTRITLRPSCRCVAAGT